MNVKPFPDDFLWGVATSAYQIEGGSESHLRGKSVWDDFCLEKMNISDGYDGNIACNHYELFQEDVALIERLRCPAYRFSISWPRIYPSGIGAIHQEGLDFYDRLIDEMLRCNIKPWVTLFHWDFPSDLYHKGGWLNRDSADWFAEYTSTVVEKLSDRVDHWITLNEPQCYIGLGHGLGIHAPGLRYGKKELLQCIHNTLLAHGKAVQAIRAHSKKKATIGWSPVGWVTYPSEENSEEIELARKKMFTIDLGKKSWALDNIWYSDPVVLGKYPEHGEALFGEAYPRIQNGDLEIISQPLDFYGVNIYHGAPITIATSTTSSNRKAGHPTTLMGWTVDPQALYWGPKFLWERYELPVYITENGIASMDWINVDGKIMDCQRIDYVERHLANLSRAIREGVDVRGYFLWSLMDNFEWELGYSRRFGLVHVDFETLERTPKKSFEWYRRVIEENGANLNLSQTKMG